jgi:ribonuclease HI
MRYKGKERTLCGNRCDATNNQMELLAVIEALKQLREPCAVQLYSDSSYVTKGINEWLGGWVRKNFKNVKNPEMWQEYLNVAKPHKVHAVWVKGHDGHEENERCDKIARDEAAKLQ